MLQEGPDGPVQWALQGWLATADTWEDPGIWIRYEGWKTQRNFLLLGWEITWNRIKVPNFFFFFFLKELNLQDLRSGWVILLKKLMFSSPYGWRHLLNETFTEFWPWDAAQYSFLAGCFVPARRGRQPNTTSSAAANRQGTSKSFHAHLATLCLVHQTWPIQA